MLRIIFLFLLTGAAVWAQNLPSAQAVLEKSIAYHDPQQRWFHTQQRMTLQQSRPDGKTDEIGIIINNKDGIFQSTAQRDSALIENFVRGDSVSVRLNGAAEISEAQRAKYRLLPERLRRMRNYYIYLYGLPMKLRDPGTHIDPAVTLTKFANKEVYALKVTYDETVGKDVWYFYFDPRTSALVGYLFYHDVSKKDGEYIILQDEVAAGNIRLPKVRQWYTNGENKYLATDTIGAFVSGQDD